MCCEHLGFEVFAACFAPCCSPVACEEGVDIEAGLEAGVLGEGEQAGPGLTRQLDPLTWLVKLPENISAFQLQLLCSGCLQESIHPSTFS